MRLEAFKTLEAVVRLGSMASAAASMSLTPSAVSMQIRQIEEYLGQPLFDRSGTQPRATPLALEVANTMKAATDHLDMLRRNTQTSIEGTLRVGVIDTMQPSILPGTLRLLKERHPQLHIKPMRGKSIELANGIKANVLDAAVVGQPESHASTKLHWHPLLRRDMVLLAPPDSAETTLEALFEKYEWIRLDRSTAMGGLAARFVNANVTNRKQGELEFDSVPAIVAMVSAGLGISILALVEPSICLSYPIRILPLPPGGPALQVSLVMRQADSDDRRLRALREAIEEVVAAIDPPLEAAGLRGPRPPSSAAREGAEEANDFIPVRSA
jgi:DNA-binding transcriptional LysR family regulator